MHLHEKGRDGCSVMPALRTHVHCHINNCTYTHALTRIHTLLSHNAQKLSVWLCFYFLLFVPLILYFLHKPSLMTKSNQTISCSFLNRLSHTHTHARTHAHTHICIHLDWIGVVMHVIECINQHDLLKVDWIKEQRFLFCFAASTSGATLIVN